jgi:CheY-like chemotaxis protein
MRALTRTRGVLLGGSCAGLAAGAAVLRRAALRVRAAATAAETLALHRAEHADLIVTDLDLPDLDAESLCQAVRADEALRNTSILVVCGADEVERRRAQACRANAHVVRPVDADALAAQITRLIAVSSRAHYSVLARVTTADQNRERSFFCRSENVSVAGILIETSEPLRLGQALDCSFFLPGRLQLVAQGRVVRQASSPKGRRFGIQFVGLSQQDAAALRSFVDRWGTLR